jgi:hypothetical protein
MRWLVIHLPHLLPPAMAFVFLARLGIWAADQPPQQLEDEEVERPRRPSRGAPRPRRARPRGAGRCDGGWRSPACWR